MKMRLDEAGSGQPNITIQDRGTSAGPMKKKKSLTRLLSTSRSFPKKSKSGSPSIEDNGPSPTLSLPVQSWPSTTPKASPRIPTMNFDNFMHHVIDQDHVVVQPTEEKETLSTVPIPSVQYTKPPVGARLADGPVRNFSAPLIRPGPMPNDHARIPPAAAARSRETDKPTLHQYPTFPISRKRSETGMRMPSTKSSLTRERGVSVNDPDMSVTHVYHHSSRPATAGGDGRTRPTGKRKPGDKVAGAGGAFPFSSVEDLPQVPQPPWQANHSNDGVRSSLRSALTTDSSQIETTSTERSSVVTRGTSISDSTVDLRSRPGSKAGGMTVDDAIDMYAAGFVDDDELESKESRDTSISEEDRRRSIKIAEAINDSMGVAVLPPRDPVDSDVLPNACSPKGMSEASYRDSQPPAIEHCTPTRDQYGFLKANHYVTVQQYDLWNNTYAPDQDRRTKKWTAFMRDHGLSTTGPTQFPNRSAKTERFIRKGIPPAWRGPAWFFYAGGEAYLKRHEGLYEYLIARSEAKLPTSDKEAIERDLHRTFPDNIHFRPDTKASITSIKEPPILTSLRRVLRAFAFHAPRIGYCQSLNFLTGLLLLFLPEEKAFWMLHIITTVYLPGTHETSLEGANVDLWVLMMALKSTIPNIWTKISAAGTPADGLDGGARLPPISLCTTSWFMSLFIGTLPIESVLRVWDVLFYEGSRTLFRVALAIFKLGEQRIRSVGDSMELFQVVQSLPRGMLDAGDLMATVCRRGGVGAQWIEARRWERKEWYAKERARALVPIEDVRKEYFAQGGGDNSDSEALKRRESIWRRKKRKGSMPAKVGKDEDPLPSPQDGISSTGRALLAI